MEQINQIRRLYTQSIGIREICRRTGISHNSVKKYIKCLSTENTAADSTTPSGWRHYKIIWKKTLANSGRPTLPEVCSGKNT